MNGKPWYRSQTILGLMATAVSTVGQVAGHALAPEDIQAAVQGVSLAGQAVGLLWAAWGRWRATEPLAAGKGAGGGLSCLVLALALGLGGCAPSKIQTLALDSEGKPLMVDGKPVILTHEMDGEAAFYDAQKATAHAAALPVFELSVPVGATMSLPGGTTMKVRASGGGGAKATQYVHPGWQVAGQVITGGLGAWGFEKMADLGKAAIAGARGSNWQFSPQMSGQSGVNFNSPSGQNNPQANPSTDNHATGAQ